MTNQINHDSRGDQTPEPVRGDRLDAMLRAWHEDHREGARAKRDEILEHIAHATPATQVKSPSVLARIGFSRILSAAAVLAVSALLLVLFTSNTERVAFADGGLVQVAEGGALDALDKDGNTLGPCPLQHTDVKVEISGLFARTIVEQTYANPYPRTIEAVYTFPLSNHAAVDRMMMIVRSGETEKTIEGEVKERSIARAMYEDARESGYVASLLEQERPNIFTQSVANIEPGATVKVRIATIELARRKNGVAEYVFPMVVGPRYIPGHAASMPTLPDGWEVREGVVLRAPAGVEVAVETPFAAARLTQLLERAIPVRAPKNETIDQLLQLGEGVQFSAKYGNGSSERGVYFPARGLGELNGRFFYAPLGKDQGTGFAGDTNQVPDASRITPMPVKPSDRAGHDISVTVTIDSGGPAIRDIVSELHAVTRTRGSDSMETVTLDDKKTIPNRDFILHWKTADTAIEPAFFTHVVQSSDANSDASVQGGYFALMLEPPARVVPADIRPRELIFVLDVSGSMNGFPVEKSKALARKAIASMRAGDTFNFITFAGATNVLWPEPRAANEENRKLAEDFVNGAYGAGGTEMMAAINAALVQDGRSGILPAKLLDMPADGRTVRIAVAHNGFLRDVAGTTLDAGEGRTIPVELSIAMPANPKKLAIIVDGTWETRNGNRFFSAKSAKFEDADARTRFVFFLTDGYIGNDQAVVAAVGQNARASRVFSFGIGNSVNRFLLEEMARAGRGTCEIVTLADEADGVIERLTRRIESPVLTDIELDISANLGIHDLLPAGDHLPDLYDQEPIVLMGRFDHAASGSITVRGRTGAGAWERTISVVLPETQAEHDVVKTLWARAKVDALLLPKLAAVENQSLDAPTKRAVIRLGESYSIATAYTSFVAIEKSRVVVGGKPMLVAVPVELPDGTNWAGFFGEGVRPVDAIIAESRGRSSVELESLAKTASTRGLISAWTDFDGSQNAPNADEPYGMPAGSAPPLYSRGAMATMPAPASRPVPAAVSMPAIATSSEAKTAVSAGKSDPQSTPPSGSVAKNQRELFEKKEGGASGAVGASKSFGGGGGGGFGGSAGGEKAKRDTGLPQVGGRVAEQRADPSGVDRSRTRRVVGGATGEAKPGSAQGSAPGSTGGFGGNRPGSVPSAGAPAADAKDSAVGDRRDLDRDLDLDLDLEKVQSDRGEVQLEAAAAADGAPKQELLSTAERDRLVRVLDRRLVLLAIAQLLDSSGSVQAIADELGLRLENGTIALAMKVTRTDAGAIDPKILQALRTLGATVSAEDASRGLLIVRAPISALIKLAAVDGVKRVEPLATK